MSGANGNGGQVRSLLRRFSCLEKLPKCKRTVLMPISHSKHCERALNYYLEHLRREEDRLHLVHLIVSESGPTIPRPLEVDQLNDYPGAYESLIHEARKLRGQYLERLEDLGIPAEFELFLANNTTKDLLKLIKGNKVHMVLLASRGHGFLRRILCGSVSTYLIQNADVPVTVVPPPREMRRRFWFF